MTHGARTAVTASDNTVEVSFQCLKGNGVKPLQKILVHQSVSLKFISSKNTALYSLIVAIS
jgi:hypothetical protein